jgi:hypothetical protein
METKQQEIVEDFDNFIKKWCGGMKAHLLDSDDNDGEYFRDRLRNETLPKNFVKDLKAHFTPTDRKFDELPMFSSKDFVDFIDKKTKGEKS